MKLQKLLVGLQVNPIRQPKLPVSVEYLPTVSGTLSWASSRLKSSSTETKPRSNIQCTVADNASPLRTLSGPRNSDDAAIVDAVITLARKFKLSVIAEGVETLEQEKHLIASGCEAAQGYLYGKPLCADDFSKLLMAKTYRQQNVG